jgi:hypothetical protein
MQSPQGGFTTAIISTFIRNALIIAVPLQNTRRGSIGKRRTVSYPASPAYDEAAATIRFKRPDPDGQAAMYQGEN